MSLKSDMMKHRIFVQRLQNAQADVIKSSLETLQKTAKGAALLGTRGKELTNNLRKVMAPLKDTAIDALADIAEYESAFAAKIYTKYLGGQFEPVDRDRLKQLLMTKNMPLNTVKLVNGKYVTDVEATKRSLSAVYDQYGRRKADEMVQLIKDSQVNGWDQTVLAGKIEELSRGLQSTQADILAQTSINYSTSTAKSQTISDSGMVQYVQWDADTELNHCDYCEGNNGEIYPIDEAPDTQVHWGCGCELNPVE